MKGKTPWLQLEGGCRAALPHIVAMQKAKPVVVGRHQWPVECDVSSKFFCLCHHHLVSWMSGGAQQSDVEGLHPSVRFQVSVCFALNSGGGITMTTFNIQSMPCCIGLPFETKLR